MEELLTSSSPPPQVSTLVRLLLLRAGTFLSLLVLVTEQKPRFLLGGKVVDYGKIC